jgi:hypothetical protein
MSKPKPKSVSKPKPQKAKTKTKSVPRRATTTTLATQAQIRSLLKQAFNELEKALGYDKAHIAAELEMDEALLDGWLSGKEPMTLYDVQDLAGALYVDLPITHDFSLKYSTDIEAADLFLSMPMRDGLRCFTVQCPTAWRARQRALMALQRSSNGSRIS